MKFKKNRLVVLGVIGIVLMFLLSRFLPQLQVVAKAGALVIYAAVSYLQIQELKRKGEEIEKPALFSVAVIVIIGYLLFFT